MKYEKISDYATLHPISLEELTKIAGYSEYDSTQEFLDDFAFKKTYTDELTIICAEFDMEDDLNEPDTVNEFYLESILEIEKCEKLEVYSENGEFSDMNGMYMKVESGKDTTYFVFGDEPFPIHIPWENTSSIFTKKCKDEFKKKYDKDLEDCVTISHC